ncbi:MerR family transcriptional regulator [Paenibacillus sp. MMS20-IR301]|uniref:MerR family transcriptional regulator n=1 Tax=Paenibacillus sp. MMS20-IR301 TaxID=2895946 RepID=UPI0028E5E472|nr:MerR family transcriptional regulator [Paenibacillus sp. MMS20-IR301]WNS45249.1 MerR family transcriptional regulator [Paenibacillus sp. MMS20-IR301]
MRTVKQVSDLTRISVRTLHYYDEIGLLKPSEITDAGYRLYDDEALEALQQILFFKELDFPLKAVKEIMTGPYYDKIQALNQHRKLLILKRDRLNGLIELVNQTIQGDKTMSFEEFDMSLYFQALVEFKREHEHEITKYFGSVDQFNELVEDLRSREWTIAKNAIQEFGSLEKFTDYAKNNLGNLPTIMEQYDQFKKVYLEEQLRKGNELQQVLTSDLSKDPSAEEIQRIVGDIVRLSTENHQLLKIEMPDNYWGYMIGNYLSEPAFIEATDKKYGDGASQFIAEAMKTYFKYTS